MEILLIFAKEIAEFLLSGSVKWLWKRRGLLIRRLFGRSHASERLPGERLVVTLYAEAEFREDSGLAGWAAWWRVNDAMLQQSGFATDITSRRQAELLALARGFDLVVRVAGVRAGDIVAVRSSSKLALDLIVGTRRLNWIDASDCRSVLRRIQALIRRRSLDVRVLAVPVDGTATAEQAKASDRCKEAATRMVEKYLERSRKRAAVDQTTAAVTNCATTPADTPAA